MFPNDWVTKEENEVIAAFRKLRDEGYGHLEVSIQDGHVVLITETRTRKLPDYRREDRKLLTKV